MERDEKNRRSNERQKQFINRQKAKGLVKRTVWLDPDDLDFFSSLMKNNRKNFYLFWADIEERYGQKNE